MPASAPATAEVKQPADVKILRRLDLGYDMEAMAVPRRMRRLGEAFYGRAAAYDRALDEAGEAELVAAVARNVLGRDAAATAPRLAAYVRGAEGALAGHGTADLARGVLRFPDPADTF